jgi:hypothetical protein
MLILHIIIALASIIYTAYVFFFPSRSKLMVTYPLLVLTLLTGSYLVWSSPAHLAETCVMGLAYLAIISVGIVAAHKKLATEVSK